MIAMSKKEKTLVLGYLRVSTDKQNIDSQEITIRRYCDKEQLIVDDWISLIISSGRSSGERKLNEILTRLREGDTLIVAELSRLGRNTSELLVFVKKITDKGIRLIICREKLDLDRNNQHDITNNIQLILFSLLYEVEKDRLIQRTKEGLRAAVLARGKTLGRPEGKTSTSIYDPYKSKIIESLQKKVTPSNIIKMIGVGKTRSLFDYINTRKLKEINNKAIKPCFVNQLL